MLQFEFRVVLTSCTILTGRRFGVGNHSLNLLLLIIIVVVVVDMFAYND